MIPDSHKCLVIGFLRNPYFNWISNVSQSWRYTAAMALTFNHQPFLHFIEMSALVYKKHMPPPPHMPIVNFARNVSPDIWVFNILRQTWCGKRGAKLSPDTYKYPPSALSGKAFWAFYKVAGIDFKDAINHHSMEMSILTYEFVTFWGRPGVAKVISWHLQIPSICPLRKSFLNLL